MDFVESIQAEGVVLERKAMGEGTEPKTPLVVEIDRENEKKDIDALDIEIPVLTPRVYREYKNLNDLDVAALGNQRVAYLQFSEEEQREIVFKNITTEEVTHTTILDTAGVADYRSVIGSFAQTIMKDLRLVSGYDVLYGKVKTFVQNELFDRPFVAKNQGYLVPKKSVFNRIIGDSQLELLFASFLEGCSDVLSYTKNYLAVHFKLDYVNSDGDITNYYPDFLVKLTDERIVVVETKGQEDLDVPLKLQRIRQWCEDINLMQSDVRYDFVYVDEDSFMKYKPKSFADLLASFREFNEIT